MDSSNHDNAHQQAAPPLTAAEVACYLGVSADVVRDVIRKKQLRAGKLGGQWRIRPSDLADYLAAQFENS